MSAPWKVIQQRLIDDGVMTETGMTRTAKRRHCRRCGSEVVAAIDDLGFDAVTDPDPVTPLAELRALLEGRRTWTRIGDDLVDRDAHRIAWADADKEKVHAQHRCGQPPLEANPRFPTPQAADLDDGPPPF